MGEGKGKGGAAPPSLSYSDSRGGARLLPWSAPLSLSTRAQQGPLVPDGEGGGPVTPGTPINVRNFPEPFWCPNIVVQYINLYVLTISRLLVMSVITSGTPNNLQYIKTYKLII